MDSEDIQKAIPSQRTRLRWLLWLTVMATLAWGASMVGYIEVGVNTVTFQEWADFEKWLFLAYGASEVGNKYSHAVMNKK